MGLCSTACVDTTLISTTSNCDLQLRIRGIDRVGFFLCNTDLPDPMSCAAIEALVESGALVFSSQLGNVELLDPETEELVIADCIPAVKSVSQRVINFQDRVAVDVAASEASPITAANPYQNYDFWNDKVNKAVALRFLFTYCDGSVQVARDKNGNPLEATVEAYVANERTTGTSPKTIEYIKGTFTFKGDPFALSNKPELDADGNVFDISQCEIF